MTIDEAITAADHEWRTLGVARRDRATLAADLRLDLEAAAADGVSATRVLDGDVRGFARRLAEEAAVRRVPAKYGQVLATAFTGAIIGAIIGAVTVAVVRDVLVASFDLPRDIRVPVLLAVVLYFGSAAAIMIGGAVAAVRIHLRQVPGIRRTAAAMSLLLPLAVAVAAPLIMAFARWTRYSGEIPVVITEIALAIAAFAGATVLARRWSLRVRRSTTRNLVDQAP